MRVGTALAALVTACGALAACGNGPAQPVGSAGVPEGMRWVGMGRVVVAVPEWWTTGETECLAPIETTVYYDSGAQADCESSEPGSVREVSALAVLDARRGYGEYLTRDMEPIGEVDGREVLERDGCERWFDGVCRRVFAVPDEGVVFAVTIHDDGDGDYQEIRDSLRLLPDGTTTVPLATADGWTPSWGAEPRTVSALVRAVEAAGLRVDVVTPEPPPRGADVDLADLPEGSYLGSEPALGSPIEAGGTVTITVAQRQRRLVQPRP